MSVNSLEPDGHVTWTEEIGCDKKDRLENQSSFRTCHTPPVYIEAYRS